MLKWIYSIILEDIKSTQSVVSKVLDVLSDKSHQRGKYISYSPEKQEK